MFAATKVRQPIGKIPDELLISNYLKSGEEIYVNELFRRYYHLIFGTCMKFLKNAEESKDVTMVIFENLFEKLKNREVMAFNQWLYTLCANECRNHLRSKEVYNRRVETWQMDFQETETGSEDATIEDLFETKKEAPDERTSVQRAISKLPEEQRKCIRMFFLKNMSYKEIAHKTNFDLNVVKSHLQNGKRRLKKMLESRFGNDFINESEIKS